MSDTPEFQRPRWEVVREVRFAVVLYGGVSLAIYINGVAQELLKMVRATAPHPDLPDRALLAEHELRGTERVYRRLGQILNAPSAQRDRIAQLTHDAATADATFDDSIELDAQERAPREVTAELAEAPIWTRFIVDIISGTSAGGINGIYLGKALANGQSLDTLHDLWVREGNIETLIYDKRSAFGDIELEALPPSLLNSRRMYGLLNRALDDMDAPTTGSPDRRGERALVDQLDLFITTTDLRGLPILMRLSDGVVSEARYRNFFQFRFESARTKTLMNGGEDVKASRAQRDTRGAIIHDRNDFEKKNNPFLAFAARCTSAFPFAFEPMELVDIDLMLGQLPDPEGLKKRWGRFFPDYQPASRSDSAARATLPPTAFEFHNRPFADGGYLDNKPFGHALDALVARRASIPVERKLVYVEPSPEHPEDRMALLTRPNAIENVSLALSLAREERIRDEVQRVLSRNRLIERIQRIVTGSEEAVRKRAATVAQSAMKLPGSSTTPEVASAQLGGPVTAPAVDELAHTLAAAAEKYKLEDVDAGIQTYGVAYAGYHRLKVAAVSDDLATAVARLANFDDDSDELFALRYLVRAWRNLTYIDPDAADRSVENRSAESGEHAPALTGGPTAAPTRTQNAFLLEYDLTYRIRRADFVLGKIDAFHCLDGDAAVMFNKSGLGAIPTDAATRAAIRAFLGELGAQLSRAYATLRAGRDEITTRPTDSGVSAEIVALRKTVEGTGITRETLAAVLQAASETARNRAAERVVRAQWAAFAGLAESLAERMKVASGLASDLALAAFAPRVLPTDANEIRPPNPLSPTLREGLRAVIRDYYLQYNYYDVIAFPILFSTEVGEELDTVDIVRISPEDAKSLIDERASGRRKLAGTALGHFGAFMQRSWRVNDILWGRLDGAERLIATALAHVDLRQTLGADLIAQAHRGVLREDVRAPDRAAMWDLVVGALQATPASPAAEQDAGPGTQGGEVDRSTESAKARIAGADDSQRRARQSFMNTESLRQFFATRYTVDRQLDRRITLDALSRSTRVLGAILQGTTADAASSTAAALPARIGTVVARLGSVVWGIVQVGVPGGLAGTFASRVFKILYVFELLLILTGVFFNGGTTGPGLLLLVLTLAAHFAVATTREYLMYGIGSRLRWVRAALIAVMIAFMAIGVTTVTKLVRDPKPLCAWALQHGWLGRLVPTTCLRDVGGRR